MWLDLKEIAAESHQSLSGLVTEAIRDFVARRRVRPVVLDQLRESMDEHAELGRKLKRLLSFPRPKDKTLSTTNVSQARAIAHAPS